MRIKKCDRCGFKGNLENHHKKHKVNGGSDNIGNRRWLCNACHDLQHAIENTQKAIGQEKARLEVLEKRLELLLAHNTPELIRERQEKGVIAYQSYWQFYQELLPPNHKCGRAVILSSANKGAKE